jgi:hypothetical protein
MTHFEIHRFTTSLQNFKADASFVSMTILIPKLRFVLLTKEASALLLFACYYLQAMAEYSFQNV